MVDPDALTFERTGERGRRSDYLSRAGWPVFPDEPHAGDRIELSDYWTDRDEGVLLTVDDEEACEFCNHETHVAERGVMPADYAIVNPDDHDEVLALTCHACMGESSVVERSLLDYEVDDVYIEINEYDSPADATLPEGQSGITHPGDRDQDDPTEADA